MTSLLSGILGILRGVCILKLCQNNNVTHSRHFPKPTVDTRMAPKRKRTAVAKTIDEDDISSSEEEEILPTKRKTSAAKGKEAVDKPEKQMINPTITNYDKINFSCDKANKSGNKWNFKITSWNVDGIRAWLKKGGLKIVEHENPDILCLQEVKCTESKLPSEVKPLNGYETIWLPSTSDGYAGVALMSKIKPISVRKGLGNKQQDEEGRIITAEFDSFYVVCVYVPNAGRKLVTMDKRMEWNKLFLCYINSLDTKKPVIICGDMNVAHNEMDLKNPKTNTKNAGFTPQEREGMTEFLSEGFVDTFREFYPDEEDAYTFWSYMNKARSKNVGWRLDYFLVSKRYMPNICENVIRSDVLGSDHCPITLFLHV